MNVVLLSGGAGKRLWPLSSESRPKQFIPIFKTGQGCESMVQRAFRQIRESDPNALITVAASKSQVPALYNQLGDQIEISVEPCRRDTFPAIVLATAYLHDICRLSEEEAVVVCPVDSYVEADYYQMAFRLSELAKRGEANLVLMGIEPTCPSEAYGYLIPQSREEISGIVAFKEKPDTKTAESYLKEGALWNSGVFAYKIGYLLEIARRMLGFADYQDLYEKYDTLPGISFDYAVAEHEKKIQVMRFSGLWRDLGTWNTLTEAMEEHMIGCGTMNGECRNVHIINELKIPILAMGLHDVIISASPEGILIADKEQSGYIKPFVEAMEQPLQSVKKTWGSYLVLDAGEESMTIKITLNPGKHMSYHCHKNRNEVWVVISGEGHTYVDGMEQQVSAGDVIAMEAGCRHTVFAVTKLQLIEVQLGREISVHDKQKYELEYQENSPLLFDPGGKGLFLGRDET